MDHPRLGHPIGVPIRIWFKATLSESSNHAVFPTINDLISPIEPLDTHQGLIFIFAPQ